MSGKKKATMKTTAALIAETQTEVRRIELRMAASVANILCDKMIWAGWNGRGFGRRALSKAVVAELADKHIEPLHVVNGGSTIYAENEDEENQPLQPRKPPAPKTALKSEL
jgi:hypothetical protein